MSQANIKTGNSVLSNNWDGIHNLLDKGSNIKGGFGMSDLYGLVGAAATTLSHYNSIKNADDAISKLGAYKFDPNAGYGLSQAKNAFLNYTPIKSATSSDFGYDLTRADLALLGSTAQGLNSFSGFGAIPAFIGGIIGNIASLRKAINEANKYNKEVNRLNKYNYSVLLSNLQNTKADLLYNSIYNSLAYGGPINILGNGVMSPFGSRFSKGGVIKNPLSSNGSNWNIGLTTINNGGRHEQNPYEGVLIGVDLEGTPNLVEEGEVIWNNYVFSNRMKVPKYLRKSLKLGDRDITYAEAVNTKKKEREERPNDPIEKRGFESFLQRLADSQEELRQKQEARRMLREAKKAVQQQAIMGALGLQSPMDAMQLQGIPDDLMMAQQPQAQGMPYAFGGEMGNLFLGLGYYPNILNFLGWGTPYNYGNLIYTSENTDLLPIDSNRLRHIERIEAINNSNDIDTINTWISKLSNPGARMPYKNEVLIALNNRKQLLDTLTSSNINNSPIPDLKGLRGGLGIPIWSDIPIPTPMNVRTTPKDNLEVVSAWKDFTNDLALGKAVNSKASPLDNEVGNWIRSLYKYNDTHGDYNRLLEYIYGKLNIPILYQSNPNKLIEDAGAANNANLRTSIMTAHGNPVLDVNKNPVTYLTSDGRELTDYSMGEFRKRALQGNLSTNNDLLVNVTPTDKLTKDRLSLTGVKVNNDLFNNDTSDNWLAALRYVPALGNAISVFSDLVGWTNKPDYSNANAVLEATKGIRDVRYRPIGDYLTYRPFDRLFYQNLLNAQNSAIQRNIVNTAGGNRGLAMAGLLTSGYNAINASGNLARLAEEYNNNQRQQVATFNRDTNKFNSLMDLEAQKANLGAGEVRLNAALNAAKLRDAIDARVGAARSANLTNLFDSIGDIGREEFTRNMINSNRALYYTIDLLGKVHYKPQFYNLPEWELKFIEQEATSRSKSIYNNGRSGANGGYLTIKRRG